MKKKNLVCGIVTVVIFTISSTVMANSAGESPELTPITINEDALNELFNSEENKAGLQALLDGDGSDASGMEEANDESSSGGLSAILQNDAAEENAQEDSISFPGFPQVYEDEFVRMSIPGDWQEDNGQLEDSGLVTYINTLEDSDGLFFKYDRMSLLEYFADGEEEVNTEIIDYILDSKESMAGLFDVSDPNAIETFEFNGTTYYKMNPFLDEQEDFVLLDMIAVNGGQLHQYVFVLFLTGAQDPNVQGILNSVTYAY